MTPVEPRQGRQHNSGSWTALFGCLSGHWISMGLILVSVSTQQKLKDAEKKLQQCFEENLLFLLISMSWSSFINIRLYTVGYWIITIFTTTFTIILHLLIPRLPALPEHRNLCIPSGTVLLMLSVIYNFTFLMTVSVSMLFVDAPVLRVESVLTYLSQQTQKRQPLQRLLPVCSFDPHDILLNSSDDVRPDIVRFIQTAF